MVIAVGVYRVVVTGIVRIRNVNGRVDDRDIVLSSIMKALEELLSRSVRESVLVVREVTVLEHVIDVCPDILQRDVEGTIVVHDFFQLCPVLVAQLRT